MKKMGYGKGYIYPHDHPDGQIRQEYFPQEVKKNVFYRPSDRAFEKEIRKKMMEKKKLEDSNK
jgi:putative ATPase